MPLFSIKGKKLNKLREISLKKEKTIQSITESNLKEIFNFKFIKTEFKVGNLRIDTLGFDTELKSFVIIEYKKEKNISVVDQGFAYLALLLNNKAEFILAFQEATGKNMRKNDVDWTQSKVIFISPYFTKYQKQAINFQDLPMELWEFNKFENNTILFNKLESPDTTASITTVTSKSKVVKSVREEITPINEETHLKVPDEIKELYHEIKSRICDLGSDIEIKPLKVYIAFKIERNFADIHIQKSQIKIWLNLPKGRLEDSKGISKDVSKLGHYGNGDYELTITPKDNLDYAMTLIRQSYEYNSLK